jgi:hypothetical protein
MGREDNLSGQSKIERLTRRLTGVEPEPVISLPIPQVFGCRGVRGTESRTNRRPKRPKGPERDKTGERTGPSQTRKGRGGKRKTPNLAHPGFVAILTGSGFGKFGRIGEVVREMQVIEIGIPAVGLSEDHPTLVTQGSANVLQQTQNLDFVAKHLSRAFLPMGKYWEAFSTSRNRKGKNQATD